MSILLDQQDSQNASFAGSMAVPLSTTPALFGTLGLNTSAATASLRVEFQATVTLSSVVEILVPVTITIVRGIGGVTVHSTTESIPVGSPIAVHASGMDYGPPNSGFLIYQAFVSIPAGFAVIPIRVGPESFNAQAYSN